MLRLVSLFNLDFVRRWHSVSQPIQNNGLAFRRPTKSFDNANVRACWRIEVAHLCSIAMRGTVGCTESA